VTHDTAILQVTSAGLAHDGSTHVVLRWEAVDGVDGYNLYRRVAGTPQRESQPLNGSTLITPPSSASQFRAMVPEGSPAWEALAHGFTAAAGYARAHALVDPAASFERGLTEGERRFVRAASQASLVIGHVAGHAYTDRTVKPDEHYLYELRAVVAEREDRRLAIDVPAWAGHFIPPDPPSGVTTQAGDRRVLVFWNRNPHATSFKVQRGTSPGGPFQVVNPKPVAFDMTTGLDGQPLPVPTPGPDGKPLAISRLGFLDLGAWTADGFGTSHPVGGVQVDGPENGITY